MLSISFSRRPVTRGRETFAQQFTLNAHRLISLY
jgi:hypothetical protein